MKAQIETYLEQVRKTKAANTYATYAQSLKLFGEWCKKEPLDVTETDLHNFANWRRERNDSSRTTFNRFLHVCIFLRAMGHRNLPGRGSYPKKYERLPEEYSRHELTALLNTATVAEKLLVEVFMCTGMRNKEIANLEVADVDFTESVIRLRVKKNWHPKSGREREVAIPRWLAEKLSAYLPLDKKPTDLLFPNSKGTVDRNLLRIVKSVAARAGLGGRVDVHKFRSTNVCQLLRSGMSLQDVMNQVGHADLKTTTRYLALASRAEVQKKSEAAFAFAG